MATSKSSQKYTEYVSTLIRKTVTADRIGGSRGFTLWSIISFFHVGCSISEKECGGTVLIRECVSNPGTRNTLPALPNKRPDSPEAAADARRPFAALAFISLFFIIFYYFFAKIFFLNYFYFGGFLPAHVRSGPGSGRQQRAIGQTIDKPSQIEQTIVS